MEPVIPVLQSIRKRELVGAGHLVANELAQVALARNERHDRDRTRRRELDELDQLLPLALDERGITDPAPEPEDELVEEKDQSLVPLIASVTRELGQACVEI